MDKVEMTIDDSYRCGGWKNWLNFSQDGQECELLDKAQSYKGVPVEWFMRKSKNNVIRDEIGECRTMGFNLDKPIYVSILSDHWDDFCPKQIKVSYHQAIAIDHNNDYIYLNKNATILVTEEIPRSHDKHQNHHRYLLCRNKC